MPALTAPKRKKKQKNKNLPMHRIGQTNIKCDNFNVKEIQKRSSNRTLYISTYKYPDLTTAGYQMLVSLKYLVWI